MSEKNVRQSLAISAVILDHRRALVCAGNWFMATLITGAGLIGTAFAQNAIARGETVVFLDPEPRADILRMKLGEKGYTLARKDVRDLPALIETIQSNKVETVVHTAGLIGPRVQQTLSQAFDMNLDSTRNVAEAVRIGGVRCLVHLSTFGVYDRRRPANGPVTEDPARRARLRQLQGRQGADPGAYAVAYGFELIVLRPATCSGSAFLVGSSGGRKMQSLIEAGLDGGSARILRRNRRTNTSTPRTWGARSTLPPPCRCRRSGLQHRQRHRDVVRGGALAAVKALAPT